MLKKRRNGLGAREEKEAGENRERFPKALRRTQGHGQPRGWARKLRNIVGES